MFGSGRIRFELGVVVLMAALILAAAPSAAAQARPNVVVVLTDDQRWDSLGLMPTVQAELVGKGVLFENAFAVAPICCPSRASFLTGLYPRSTLVYRNQPPYGGYEWFDDSSTVATWLTQAGYRTAYYGKYLNGYFEPDVPPGWSSWLASERGYYDFTASENGIHIRFGALPDDYSTDVFARAAKAFIDADDERPFFVVYAPYAPHYPATPAPRHLDTHPDQSPWRPPAYDEEDVRDKPAWVRRLRRLTPQRAEFIDTTVRSMRQSLLAVDDGVRSILDTLEETGRLRDTMIVYTSDNGLLWGEHRMVLRKAAAYEESTRIPFVVRYDRLGHGARTETRLVANVDLAPTLTRLASARSRRTEGRSLLPLLRNDARSWRTQVLLEHLRGAAGNARGIPSFCGLRGQRWKYVAYKTQEEELYDLATDPGELQSVHRDPVLRNRLLRLRRAVRRLCDPAPPGLTLTWLCTYETGAGRRTASGTSGADTVCGGAGADRLLGRGGDDVLYGRTANDSLAGGRGNDRLEGGAGGDRLTGGPGRDTLVGGPGQDTISGGGGRDLVQARDGARDRIACGPGRDVVYADTSDVVAADCEDVRRPRPPRGL